MTIGRTPVPIIPAWSKLTPAAAAGLERTIGATGMRHYHIISRLVEWFARQPLAIQTAVLGQERDTTPDDAARMVIRALAGE